MDFDSSNSSGSSSGGGGGGSGSSFSEHEEPNSPMMPCDHGTGPPTPTFAAQTLDLKSNFAATGTTTTTTTSTSSPSKKSSGGGNGGRRSVQKRVVTVPISEVDGSRPKGSGEGAPPSDSWAWRKYGQKPIKGSPYPRGYYRCSSSKGCPARKQVERSRLNPTMLVVTYASEHNHPWPLPKNHRQQNHSPNSHQPITTTTTTAAPPPPPKQETEEAPLAHTGTSAPATPGATTTNTTSTSSPEDNFSTDLGEETSLMLMTDEFPWYSDMTETSLPTVDVAMMLPVSYDDVGKELSGNSGSGDEEEDSLFAGLGELPECSVVFRRGFLERQVLNGDATAAASRGCSLTATSWCGSSG